MKKIYLFFVLCISPFLVNAQNSLINPSFETWTWADSAHTIEYPDSWGSPSLYPVYKSTDACNGNYSVLLTDSLYNIGDYVTQLVTWTGNAPSGISFCYKFDHKLGDSAYFQATIEDQGTSGYLSSVNIGFNQDVSTWTNVSLNFATFAPISGTFKLAVTATCFQPFVGPTSYSYFKIDNINLLYPVGMNEIIESQNNVSILPNPSNGQFKLIRKNNSNVISVEVYNMIGEKVFQSIPSGQQSEIDLSNQTKGIYFVKIYDGEKTQTKKIIIQ